MHDDKCDEYFRPWNTKTDTSEPKSSSSISTETVIETDSIHKNERDNERSPSPIINKNFPSTGNLDRLSNFVMNVTSSENCDNYDHSRRLNTDSSSSESGASHGSTSPPSVFASLSASTPADCWAIMANNLAINYDMMSSPYRELYWHFVSTPTPPNYLENAKETVRLLREQEAAKRMKKLRPKTHHCQYCKVAFSNNGQLQGHIRIHTGERPFKCNVETCGKSFTRNEELTRHKKIHTGDRPFVCNFCPKRFGRKDHLKKHENTHLNRSESYGFDESAPSFNIFRRQSGPLLPVMPSLSTVTPSAFAPTTILPLSSPMIPSPTSMSSSLQSPLLPPPLFQPPPMIPLPLFRPRKIIVSPVPQPYFSSVPITSTPILPSSRSTLFSQLPEMMLQSEFSSLPNPDLSSLPDSTSSNSFLSPTSSVESTIDHQLDYINRYDN